MVSLIRWTTSLIASLIRWTTSLIASFVRWTTSLIASLIRWTGPFLDRWEGQVEIGFEERALGRMCKLVELDA
jgi:hypothetical protein